MAIHAKEQPLSSIFSDAYAFQIPPYQRPYSWSEEQTSALLNDILAATEDFRNQQKAKNAEVTPYFLGSIVLIKPSDGKADSEVIDGQQRLTTLTLLLAAARAIVENKDQQALDKHIFERGNRFSGTKDRPRLTLRDRDHRFFEEHILQNMHLRDLEQVTQGKLTDPQRKLIANCQYLFEKIKALDAARSEAFLQFLLQHTYLVAVSTPNLDSAFRIFSVLNDRGLDLSVADILKAEIIGRISTAKQDAYTEKWEDAEEALGTDRFADLFSHIRMIHGRAKLRKSVLEGFRESVKADANPEQFIDDELMPLADALGDVLQAKFQSAKPEIDKQINHVLRLLHRLVFSDWIAPAILYVRKHRDSPDKLLAFLTGLERLAMALWLRRQDEDRRIDRAGKLIAAIEADENLAEANSPLQLSAEEKGQVIEVLNGNIYELSPKPKRTAVLLRLDELLASGEASYEFDRITVEHVLPQNPEENSQWVQWWPDPENREQSVHRLGNLALLNRRQNSAAKNWEFDKKRDGYFRGKSGTSPFALTTQVLALKEWTPEVFFERQDQFVEKLKQVWQLD